MFWWRKYAFGWRFSGKISVLQEKNTLKFGVWRISKLSPRLEKTCPSLENLQTQARFLQTRARAWRISESPSAPEFGGNGPAFEFGESPNSSPCSPNSGPSLPKIRYSVRVWRISNLRSVIPTLGGALGDSRNSGLSFWRTHASV